MVNILHIDSSVRDVFMDEDSHSSISKTLAAQFVEIWKNSPLENDIIYHDLGINPPDFITQDWISAAFTDANKRTENQNTILSTSDTLIEELDKSDIILISSPMYNYGVPASLKAWFDQVIRINKTFSFDLNRGDYPLKSIMSGKTLVLITSCGEFGFGKGQIRESMNHLGPHIKVMSQYLGVENFHEIRSEYHEFNDERHQRSLAEAKLSVANLAQQLMN